MTLLTSAGFPPTAGPLTTPQWTELFSFADATNAVTLANDYQQDVSLRSTGKTLGAAGALFFGVGPATQNGVPRGVNINDYFSTHAASGSFM